MTNFGVDSLLEFMGTQAAAPASRKTEEGDTITPENERFTGFIFKIQANMNPRHRDRIAFLRVVSGQFERGMDVTIGRSGEKLKLAKPHSFMAQERSIVENAWPGDIVGLYDPENYVVIPWRPENLLNSAQSRDSHPHILVSWSSKTH